MRIASIDIGTNTIRLLISDKSPNGELKQLYLDRVITRLGEGFSEELRLIQDQSIRRSLDALARFSELIREYNVERTRAVATSVVRESLNGNDFVNKVRNQTGLDVEIISGEEEAKLTVLGVINSVDVPNESSVIFDIGGGSTEYVNIHNSEILSLVSTNLGVVHLTEEFLINETESEMRNLSEYIQEILASELGHIKDNNERQLSLVGTAGTPTTLAAIQQRLTIYDPDLVNNFVLTKDQTSSILSELMNIPRTDRANFQGLEKGREDIIISGTVILLETMDYFNSKEVIVSDGGVLEGIAYSINS